ncbi:MAG: vanadium-dependent haloperoxidase [Flavobacteriales bacterium]|nr:vanadium-dependent haloperoxidase [Flavobacteriales bacterium]
MKKIIGLLLVIFAFSSCQEDDLPAPVPFTPEVSPKTSTYSGDFLRDYITLTCKVAQTTDGFFPTQAARAYGYIGVAAYESVVYGINPENRLEGQLDGLAEGTIPDPLDSLGYNWAIACNAATADMMRYMFDLNLSEENRELIDNMEEGNLALLTIAEDEEVVMRSIAHGQSIAQAIYQVSMTDGGHESYLDPFQLPYDLAADDYCWVPTDVLTTTPLSPYWRENRSMIPGIVPASQPIAPIEFSTNPSSQFYGQAFDTYNQVMNLNSEEEREIAEYWADDPFATCTPAGHTFNIINQLLGESGATLEKTAVGIGMMAIAENDAFIACWESKYEYILIRPVSYIQQYIDPAFETTIGTPPFPAYTSGHSAEIGAGVKVLVHLFAEENGDYTFTDLSQLQYGFSARTYDNFYEMADECALSRFYGGIHYEMDNSRGLDIGFAVGSSVVSDISWPDNIQ